MADLLSAISVFLVFLTFLINAAENQVKEFLNQRKPEKEQLEKLTEYKKKYRQLLFLKLLPITIAFFLSFYILLPKSCEIIFTSKISLWNFDSLNTLFVLINFGVFAIFLFSLSKVINVLKKYNL